MEAELRIPQAPQAPSDLAKTWEEARLRDKHRVVQDAERELEASVHTEERLRAMAEWKPVVRVLPDQRLRVALLGAVNTGKTTLYNCLTCPTYGRYGRKPSVAGAHDALTRDAVETVANFDGMVFTIIDTPGVFNGAIVEEAKRSLQTADLVLFVVSAAATHITADEYALAEMLRAQNVPSVLVINKRDAVGDTELPDVVEAFRHLGLGRGVCISAASRVTGFDALAEVVRPLYNRSIERRIRADWALEDTAATGDEDAMDEVRTRNSTDPFIRVAFVGAPNTGKSSLLNRLVGFDRSRAANVAMTTRDAIEVPCMYRGRKLRLLDTGGLLRSRYSRTSDLTRAVHNATMQAIKFAHVVVVVIDATDGHPTDMDMAMMHHSIDEGRGVVMCANKWDAVMDHLATAEAIDYKLKKQISEVRRTQAVVASAQEGTNLTLLLDQVLETYDTWSKKVSGAELTRFWRRYERSVVIPHHVSRVMRISQVGVRPPTFRLFLGTRDEEAKLNTLQLHTLRNAIAEEFDFSGVPLRFIQTVKEAHPDR